MFATSEQVVALNAAALDAAVKLARVSIETTERVFNAGVEASRQAAGESGRFGSVTGEFTSIKDFIAVQGQSLESNLGRIFGLSRTWLELAQQAQKDYAAVVEANAGSLSKAMSTSLDQSFKVTLPGADAAISLIKSTAEASNAAFDNLAKVAKQAVKVAEAEAQVVTESVAARAKSAKAK